ncbi:MAG: DUF748 domain-containing protein, partial [Myxococcota bacterium]
MREAGHRRLRWFVGIGIVFLVALIALRLALPTIVQHYVNRVLDRDPDYEGSIGDVDISLIRGAYVVEAIEIRDTTGEAPVPLFSSPAVHLSVSWKSLIRGALVGEIEMIEPQVNFVDSPKKGGDQTGADADWREVVLDLFPLRIDRFAVTDGQVHYQSFQSKPPVDVYLSDVEVEATNLTNSTDISDSLAADIWVTAQVMDYGAVRLQARFDPFADQPTFDLNLEAHDVPLVKLNDLLEKYAKFDVESGRMDVYAEIAADSGKFTGYVKPILRSVKVLKLSEDVKEDHDGPLQVAWEAVAGAVKGVFNNEKAE